MFSELMPLLTERTVVITVARESGTTIRATIVLSENAALSTPLSFVGTPEELDCDLAKELAAYVDTHRQLGSTLAQAKATMEAAARAAQEEAKRKADDKRKAKSGTSAPAPAPSAQPEASVSRDPVPGTTSSLFGGAPTGPAESQPGGGGCRLSE
jgi:PRTRC genetic system protein E